MGYTLELIKFLIIIGILGGGAYFIAKKIKKGKTAQESMQGMMEMQDSLSIGMQQNVSLVKVGDEYVLIASSNHGMSMIKLDSKQINSPKKEFDEAFGAENAHSALQRIKEKWGEKLK
jgi:flagellar biogenesis protein FliO